MLGASLTRLRALRIGTKEVTTTIKNELMDSNRGLQAQAKRCQEGLYRDSKRDMRKDGTKEFWGL